MFYALCVKIFFSLSAYRARRTETFIPFFSKRRPPPFFLQCLLELVLLYVKSVAVGNKLNIDTYDIITSELREYFRMLAMHSDTYSPLSGFLDPSQ